MKTCHQYYTIGVPEVLRFPVTFDNPRFVKSFHDFMFATSPTNRFRFLKDVTINGTEHSSYSTRQNQAYQKKILLILSHSTSLERLRLSRMQSLLDNFPSAVDKLSKLSMLREIECRGSPDLVGWLGQLRAPLTKLKFYCYNETLASSVDLFATISHFRDTLRTLSIGYLSIGATDPDLQFPHVDTLNVEERCTGLHTPSYSASTIFRLFPNLKYLKFPDRRLEVNDLVLAERYHKQHMVDAARNQISGHFLEELSGCVDDLYRGAYICRVGELSVHQLCGEDIPQLLPLIAHMQPSALTLDFRMTDCLDPMSDLSSILRELSTDNTLQQLSLDFDFMHTAEPGIARGTLVRV